MVYDLTNIFHRTTENPRSKLLFIMGGTWHTKALFDIDVKDEDSAADLFFKRSIETLAFDTVGTGIKHINLPFGNRNADNVNVARQLISGHNIKNVLCYSYGCNVLIELMKDGFTFDHVILLDPKSQANPRKEHRDDDIIIYDKIDLIKNFKESNINLSPRILQAHLNAMVNAPNGKIITPYYPNLLDSTAQEIADLQHLCPFRIVFSNQSRANMRELFDEDKQIMYDDASHWMLIEEARHKLVDYIADFILQ
jgi:hypothetical protein